MNNIIHNFIMEYQHTLYIPANAKPVDVRWDANDNLVMSVLLDPQAATVARHFRLRAAGIAFPGRIRYVAPVTFDDGKVMHLIEELP